MIHTKSLTPSGRIIDFRTFSEDDISLDDIAHALTKICRYGGALPLGVHYSVAQHCLELNKYALKRHYSRDFRRSLLLHDAAEAYTGDMLTGLKPLIPGYSSIESRIQTLINNKFRCKTDKKINTIMREFDKRIVIDECAVLLPLSLKLVKKYNKHEALGINIVPEQDIHKVKKDFIKAVKETMTESLYPTEEELERFAKMTHERGEDEEED